MSAYSSSFDSTPRKSSSVALAPMTGPTSSSAIPVKWDHLASDTPLALDPFAPWPSNMLHAQVGTHPEMAYVYSDDVPSTESWSYEQPAITTPIFPQLGAPSETSMDPSAWSASDCSASPTHNPDGQDHNPASALNDARQPGYENSAGTDPYTDGARPDSKMASSAGIGSHPGSVLNRDSTRRSNARIEIPENRNLATIEQLIKHARNDDDVKELKAQRRLLRNREAALASRQRKKRHTEDLEVKERDYTSQITALECQIAELRLKYTNAEDEIRLYQQQHANAYSLIEILQAEKEEMATKHTRETGLLRQRIQYLTHTNDNMLNPTMPTTTATDYNQVDALGVSPRAWDDLFFSTNSCSSSSMYDNADGGEQRPSTACTTPASIPQSSLKQTNLHQTVQTGAEPPVASGILFMLLLCGAFVASKSTTYTKVPAMPDEVRAASTTVLDNLLQEHPTECAYPPQSESAPMPAAQSAWQPQHSSRPDRLGALHQQMTGISKDQHAAQLFAMTPDEYNGFTSTHGALSGRHGQANVPAVPLPRRNLAESLANAFPNHNERAGGDVYTRSLLWDRIPDNVVKQFKDLVQLSRASDDTMNFSFT